MAGVQTSYGATGTSQGHGGGTRLDHVFIIMLENHAADHVIGDPNGPDAPRYVWIRARLRR